MREYEPAGYDESQSLAFGHTVLERVLLAIINAHTTQDTKESAQSRLRMAMRALVGTSATGATPDGYDKALLFMARERHKDECHVTMHQFKNRNNATPPPEPKVRSYAALANEAAATVLNSTNEQLHANAKRLEEMISGRHQTRGDKRTNVDFARTYRFRAVEHDYVGETLEAESVQRICDELAEWGVTSKI